MKNILVAGVVGIAVTGVVSVVLFAQTPQPPPQPTFRTEANYVRVDVYPTKDGAPVGDLTATDFEVLENGAPQQVEQFEHVVIRGNVPQDVRREPQTVAESRDALADPRARVFVIFLDPGHVDIGGSYNIRRPLIDTLNRAIGVDDLVAVMTPEMSALDLTFARKTTTIEGFLTRYWHWGERDRVVVVDPVEQAYESCYGPQQRSEITREMILRRREKRTLDALEDLVVHLRSVREERKAILAITDGWLLYRPSQMLANASPPTPPPIGLVPGTGRLTIGDRSAGGVTSDCERDRLNLAQIDDEQSYRQLLDEANRANATFYPIDPRGLAVFDTPINAAAPLALDSAMLRQRSETLRTLAAATDGTAIISNDIAGGLRRVVADLSSYYLLGYYSSGKLDGRFHSITVRVKRPGVQVRARRGYLAATPAAATAAAAARAGAAVAPAPDAETLAIAAALAPLPAYARDVPLRIEVVAGWRRSNDGQTAPAFWVVGEFASGAPADRSVDATVIDATGAMIARGSSPAGSRSVLIALAPSATVAPGEYTVRVRSEGSSTSGVTVKLPPAPDAGGALFYRRGMATGNKDVPTADRRFRRNEQVRVEMPIAATGTASARLLDRTGKALAIPVTAAVREDADGSRWQTAQLALAPLAPGDYVIELASRAGEAGGAGRETRTLVALRIVP
jgi:VWFA-related protein